MLNMLATLAEYERELIIERVSADIAVARNAGTKFGRPISDPILVGQKLVVVAAARASGKSAQETARLGGWSRATFYRHKQTWEGA